MRKLLRLLGFLFLAVVAALAIAAVSIYQVSEKKLGERFVVNVRDVASPSDSGTIARGKHLAITRGCAECHGADLAGATVFDNGAMGRVDGPNLTRGEGGLPASYTEADFIRATRHGVAGDGRGLFLMPATDFATLSDADMGALLAYWKSMPPVNRTMSPVELGPVSRALLATGKIKLAAAEIDHAHVKPSTVTPGATVEYGRYVAASCAGCHGANFSGGKIAVGPPDWPPAANLTPHSEGRIANWKEEDFVAALRTAKRPDGTEINPVMPRVFGELDDVELKALWMFLRTLPAVPTSVR